MPEAQGMSPPMAISLEQRFWEYTDKRSPEECWLWLGSRTTDGYGRLIMTDHRFVKAHRLGYEIVRGKIPEGLQLDHLCRNPICVNPWHLEVVDNRTNARRGKSGILAVLKTHCPKGHEFTPENTYLRSDRFRARRCRICSLERGREYKQRKRAAARAALEQEDKCIGCGAPQTWHGRTEAD